MSQPTADHPIFGPVIHRYTRAQAFADGALVDLTGLAIQTCKQAGFKIPVACTAAVFSECIALTPAAERAGNDLEGRLWDVLFMAAAAARSARARGDLLYRLRVVRKRVVPTPTTLKLTIGPGDDGEPVATILFPEED